MSDALQQPLHDFRNIKLRTTNNGSNPCPPPPPPATTNTTTANTTATPPPPPSASPPPPPPAASPPPPPASPPPAVPSDVPPTTTVTEQVAASAGVSESNKTQLDPQSVSTKTDENKKRFFVIQEIVSTEATYIDRLKIALEHVIKPLSEQKLIDAVDMEQQFSVLENIYELHNRHSIVGSSSQNLKFIGLFEDMGENISIYSTYLVNFEPAMARRAALLTSNRRFADFIDRIQKSPQLQGQNIESLLILPVQRIPRYRLLLEQLLKYTSEDHPDYSTVNSALDKICQLAHYNNEAIRARENNNKLMSIMMQIQPTNRPNLLEGNRKFIKEATLQKQCRKRYKEFQFWLMSDCLLYGEMTPIGMYMLNRWLPLNGCRIKEVPSSDPDHNNALVVQSPQKSFKLRTSGPPETKEWLAALNDAIEKHSDQSKNLCVVAPIWDPDFNSSKCSLCDASFTILFRRHHCRNCGKLVCTNCSSKKFLLENVSTGVVRVCDPCYDNLVPAATDKASVPSIQDDRGDSSGDDSDNSEKYHEREVIDEDALDDYNEAERMLQSKGVTLNAQSLESLQSKKTPGRPIQSRPSFFQNLTSGLIAAAASLRPVAKMNDPRPPPPQGGSAQQQQKKTIVSNLNNDSPTSGDPPRRPRRPNAIKLVALTDEQIADITKYAGSQSNHEEN